MAMSLDENLVLFNKMEDMDRRRDDRMLALIETLRCLVDGFVRIQLNMI